MAGQPRRYLVVKIAARLTHLIASLDAHPMSRSCFRAGAEPRPLPKYASLSAAQGTATIETGARQAKARLADVRRRALAMPRDGRQRNQTAYPKLQPLDAFLKVWKRCCAPLIAGRQRSVTDAAQGEPKIAKNLPAQTWRSEMSTMTINGPPRPPDDRDALLVRCHPDRLAYRDQARCGSGVCGACTGLLDGAPVVSCCCRRKRPAANR